MNKNFVMPEWYDDAREWHNNAEWAFIKAVVAQNGFCDLYNKVAENLDRYHRIPFRIVKNTDDGIDALFDGFHPCEILRIVQRSGGYDDYHVIFLWLAPDHDGDTDIHARMYNDEHYDFVEYVQTAYDEIPEIRDAINNAYKDAKFPEISEEERELIDALFGVDWDAIK